MTNLEPDPIASLPEMRSLWRKILPLELAAFDMRRQREEIEKKLQEINKRIRDLQIEYRTEYNRRSSAINRKEITSCKQPHHPQ